MTDLSDAHEISYAETSIFALSTVAGRAALSVVRLSGPHCDLALNALGIDKLPTARQASLRRLYAPETGALLDEALVLRFRAPHSFTGEDMVELHLHGGMAVSQSVIAVLGKMSGLQAAQGGDFTRRAVLNGKMDLTAAEAIADLIDAEGGAQQAQALKQMEGALRLRLENWRDRLKTMLAHIEADIEFADEDLPGGLGRSALAALPDLMGEIQAICDDRRGIALRDGLRVALLGPPNAGKSSILNMLVGRDAAIVSARAGTTRDVIEVAMHIGGVPVTLVDTAGLREAGDDIEREGVKRAQAQAERADIRLLVLSPDTVNPVAAMGDITLDAPDLTICNKADLVEMVDMDTKNTLSLSSIDGSGGEALLAALHGLVAQKGGLKEAPIMTRERHLMVLQEALSHLLRGHRVTQDSEGDGMELAAEDLRLAQRVLGRITGAVDVEQLLDVVFADFCIGK